jgi:Asp-tRNA(Asn)/Glu-tRNA(Gln) amidotransferase A subunit family amidase
VLPNVGEYRGLPIEFGAMRPTKSDPAVHQQYGMVAGVSNAGQLGALTTLNIRGERSVTCKGAFDTHPSTGPLPADAPAECEAFRRQPDALERAAELDAAYGRNPDLAKLPMYCVVLSFKDSFDTRDMRTTSGADVAYATDAPPEDSTIVAELRAKGAIIYAKANLAEYNAGSGNPGGAAKPAARDYGAGARSSWGGPACNPYDTARETGGSSSGSASSVAANLVQCSICEETGGSCRQPAWRNNVVGLVTTKGLMQYGGVIGADPYLDRAGIHCRTVKDTASVLDALKNPERGYFDPRDPYSALPSGLVSKQPYASFLPAGAPRAGKPLSGVRVGIVREYMVKHSRNDEAVAERVNEQIKYVLRDQLGAELVESMDPLYADDPAIPNMTYTFQDAIAEILPFHMPELLKKKDDDGGLLFAVPGYDVTKRDYMVKVAERKAPLSPLLNLRSINDGGPSMAFAFHIEHYLMRRGDATVKDWATLNAHASYYNQGRLAAMTNWQNVFDLVAAGQTQDVKMREVMRLVVEKVMQQNRLDALVNPTTTVPPARIGFASQPTVASRPAGRFPTSANVGIPEITVPAGFNSVIYEPEYVLNAASDAYTARATDTKSTMAWPMPFGISFWGGPGDEPALFRIAGAYEAATRHRKAPPAFGPASEARK